MNRFRSCRPALHVRPCRPSLRSGPPAGPPASRASIRFLAEAFAVWCDQKSRLEVLSGAKADSEDDAADSENAVLDDESHDALADAYARTRELIGALLAQAETQRAADREARQEPRPPFAGARLPDSGEGERPREPVSTIEMDDGPTAPGRRACPAC